MELNKENIKKIRGLIIFAVLSVVCVWKYKMVLELLSHAFGIVFPFVLGGAIAFVLNVPMNFFERHIFGNRKIMQYTAGKKMARPLSLVVTLLSVIGVVGLVLFVVIPQLAETFSNLGASIQAFIPKVQEWAREIFDNKGEIVMWVNQLEFNWDKMLQMGLDFFQNGAGSVLDSTFEAARSIISGVTTFFIAFVFACYILLQKERLNVQVRKVLFAFMPRGKAEATLEVCSLTYKTFSSFLTGQCVEAIILGSMFVITMSICRMPYALLVGVLIAFTALIPVFGAFIGCVVGAFLIFMVNPMQALGFVILFLVLQQIEGNFIYPHVVGNSVGLPSIWVLAAVSIGADLMGIVGMLVFIPIVSVVYALFREVVYLKLRKRELEEQGKLEKNK